MMIATTFLLVTLTILIHGQVGNSHVATLRQTTDSLKSGTPRSFSIGEVKDRLEFDEGSGTMETMINVDECLGTGFEVFTILLQNPSGCFTFQTTGFDMNGYANNTGISLRYVCAYTLEFGATVSGTVTVKEQDFQFQEPDSAGDCFDSVSISIVNDEPQQNGGTDLEDRNTATNAVQYCGTITGDKIRDFSNSKLFIQLVADDTENGNGAEIVICIN